MNYSVAQRILETHLANNWSLTPIAWRNIEPRLFSSPSQPLLPDGDTDYIDVMTDVVGNTNVTVNNRCSRGQLQLTISVCVKEGTGIRTARTYLDTIVDLYDSRTLSGVEGTVRVGTLGGSAGYPAPNGWYVENAHFQCYFERHRL